MTAPSSMEFHKGCGGVVRLTDSVFRCGKCGHVCVAHETFRSIVDKPVANNEPYPLYVVGQRRDGSYETFELQVPEGEGIDAASEACASRRLTYIHCARPRSGRLERRKS